MAMAVAALGAVAGSAAGGFLKQATEQLPKAPMQAPKIDIAPIMGFYNAAGQSYAQGKTMADSMYKRHMGDANLKLQQGYAAGNQDLPGISQAGIRAYNEYLRMIGIDPIQKTTPLETKLDGIGFAPGAGRDQLKQLMEQATNERDPTKRMVYKSQIYDKINKLEIENNEARDLWYTGEAPLTQQMPTEQVTVGKGKKATTETKIIAPQMQVWDAKAAAKDGYAAGWKSVDDTRLLSAMQQSLDQFNAQQTAEWQRERASITQYWGDRVKQGKDARSALANEWLSEYTPEYDDYYNAEELNQKITETPGYTVALEGGTQALQRSAAATGMLGSGNTLMALQDYGQELAKTTYQNTLSTLLGAANQGFQATQQLSQNEIGKGQDLAQMAMKQGEFAATNQLNASKQRGDLMLTQAQSLLKVAEQNAMMKMKWDMDAKMNHPGVSAKSLSTQTMPEAPTPKTF